MWCCYIAELLNLYQKPEPKPGAPPNERKMPNAMAMQAKLVKAEFHGAILEGESQDRIICLIRG